MKMVATFKGSLEEAFTDVPGGDRSYSKNKEVSIPLEDLDAEGRPWTSDTSDGDTWRFRRKSNPLKRFFHRLWSGPEEVRDERPQFSNAVISYLDELPKNKFNSRLSSFSLRILALIVYVTIWFGVLYSLLYPYLVRAPFFHSNGESTPIITLTCNSYLNWAGTNNACGLNAEKCGPFTDREYYIRCPALCDRQGWTFTAMAVGDQRIKYTGYEIGGGTKNDNQESDELSYPYRADSYPCSAAIHAGVISPYSGGCAKLTMDGPQKSFPKAKGTLGQWSVNFDSFFPGSFSFRSYQEGIASGCYDPRVLVVVLNILFGLPVLYLYDSIISYWLLSLVGYWTVALALDPPVLSDPHNAESVYVLLSVAFQRLLPLCFILYVIWKCASKRTMEDGSPVLKVFAWYPTFWLGIMNNVTFDRLPVDRLTMHDLKEESGALTAVASIITTILICAIIQAYALWKSGRFQKYFKIYISMIVGLCLLSSIPGMTLRIHHYILGMILIPGCATRGFSAYLFQGILLGLFISGVARWDFASIVETNLSLLRGEAGVSLKPPIFDFGESFNHRISWHMGPNVTSVDPTGNIDGFSLLINDFEVYVGKNESVDLDILMSENEVLGSMMDQMVSNADDGLKLYMRVAQASTRSPDSIRGDYTNAGILEWPQGVWHEPKPGVS
ncbi:hypothetical protein HG535_0E03430 [Zygotorulaspora mrakii]|uniref:LCCL domain-containing protein n=1 Tax=Zygotorulaspora mrakii TaxID=42260 RepID=A0A7H9B5M5_ZYGMR|nr:uncharacterized protein HG535_0E03430 [Zygotorulaspora mrakii]QLG73259.1 hypothetical protein HG535_0E03430 [Zygotorulaspora mrakii]